MIPKVGLVLFGFLCLSRAAEDAELSSKCSSPSPAGSEVNVYTELGKLRSLVAELSAKLSATQEELRQQKATVDELKNEKDGTVQDLNASCKIYFPLNAQYCFVHFQRAVDILR